MKRRFKKWLRWLSFRYGFYCPVVKKRWFRRKMGKCLRNYLPTIMDNLYTQLPLITALKKSGNKPKQEAP